MRQGLLLLFTVVPGVIGFLIFGGYAIIDYAALQQAYGQFEQAAHVGRVTAIMVAEAQQNIHRINLFAEGVWALLSALIAAVGLHGLCMPSQRTP
ncbi:MAG TPA: hypothetical protein VGL77_13115 [Armatimonadota bacterium]|jgi:hypothetical protein